LEVLFATFRGDHDLGEPGIARRRVGLGVGGSERRIGAASGRETKAAAQQ